MKIIFGIIGERIKELANDFKHDDLDIRVRMDELARLLMTVSERITDIEYE